MTDVGPRRIPTNPSDHGTGYLPKGEPHRRWTTWVGVLAAMLVCVGFGALSALQHTPFQVTDESAHLAAAHEIADGQLPDITAAPDVPDSSTTWRAERAAAPDDRYRGAWVANHPPLPYLLLVPAIWWSDASDRPDGGLLFLRLTNVAWAAVGVGLTFALGRELAGGVAWVGVVAASVVALLPHAHDVFSHGLTDGMAFAAVTFVAWAGVVCLQRGVSTPRIAVLAAATAVAAGTRLVALAVAFVVVVVVAAAQLLGRRAGGARAATLVLVALVPAAAQWGWFYVRNAARYGDLAASEFLLDRFGREPRGSWGDVLGWGHLWVDLHRALLWRSPPITGVPSPPFATLLVTLAAAGLVVVAATRRSSTRAPSPHGDVGRATLLLAVVVLAVVVALTAQHVAGGGGRYARYLLPSVGVAAALIALGWCRLSRRVLPVLGLALLAVHAVRITPRHVDPTAVRRSRDDGPMPLALQVLPSTSTLRAAATVALVVGLVALLVALLSELWPRADHGGGDRHTAAASSST